MRPISLLLFGVLLLAAVAPSFARAVDVYAAASDNDLASVQELLKADPTLLNAPDPDGRTLLIIAAAWGYLPMVNVLLDSKAEVNRVDKDGFSALHWAAGTGHRAVVELLLRRGINHALKDKAGRTAQQFALERKQSEVAKLIADFTNKPAVTVPPAATIPPAAAVTIPRGLVKPKEKAVLARLGNAQYLTLSWGAAELTPESLAAGTEATLAADRRQLQARGLPDGLIELALRKAGTRGIRTVQVGISARPTPAEIAGVLGEPASREKDEYRDPAQPDAPAQPLVWLKYGWLQFGAVADRVLAVRIDCPLLESARLDLLPKAGQVIVNKKDNAEAVYVPEGEFTMGNDRGDADERPMRKVTLDAFWIYKREVTVGQFRQYSKATGKPLPPQGTGINDTFPVVNVSWEEALAYAAWAGGRLPTEAEWEKAARGTDGWRFPWGNELDVKKCNSKDLGRKRTMPVGSFPAGASPYGALDMEGNVYEWCQDWYYVSAYYNSPKINPKGPATAPDAAKNYNIGPSRVIRGGSYESEAVKSYAANRKPASPGERAADRGFRIVYLPPEE
jgi:formylglycine-generating enzyme required for sulfatase activity